MKDILGDEFLSAEDLDLKNLDDEELIAVWNNWLLTAQATNDLDKHRYSHSAFADEVIFEEKEPT